MGDKIKHKIIFYGLVIVISATGLTVYEKKPRTDYLTFSYAQFIRKNPGGEKNISEDEKELHISIAKELTKVGCQYYQLNKNKEAIEKYEEALSHYVTDDLYFYYANSLAKTNRPADVIRAYKIAIALCYNKNKQELYYNIACAYSRLKNKEMAYEYLELALINGYKNIELIKKDHDLDLLRSKPEWEKWLNERRTLFEQPSIPRTGLVVEYLFNGDATDMSGNGNNGIVNGATLTTDRFGNENSAYSFNGVTDYVKINSLLTIGKSNAITIGYWFYLTDHTDYDLCGYIADKNNALRLGLDFDRHIYVDAGTHTDVSSSAITFDLNKWYHYVMAVKGGDSAIVYVNGQIVFETTTGIPDILKNPPHFMIGASDETLIERGVRHHLRGVIDDVRIYNRSLTEEEIQALYQENDWLEKQR